MHTVMGIDPGKKGGIVCLDQKTGKVRMLNVMPRDDEMRAFAVLVNEAVGWGYPGGLVAVLEQAAAIPVAGRTQGAQGMFNYGRGFGRLEGILSAFNVPCILVPPRTWTAALTASFAGEDAKARAKGAATAYFPHVELTPKGCRKPHEGLIDALLIAEWGRRKLDGEPDLWPTHE